jgi:hypothetical protein
VPVDRIVERIVEVERPYITERVVEVVHVVEKVSMLTRQHGTGAGAGPRACTGSAISATSVDTSTARHQQWEVADYGLCAGCGKDC